MKSLWKRFMQEEDGMGVIEIVIIIAVLVAIALFFRREIIGFFQKIVAQAFPQDGQINELDNDLTRNTDVTP